MTYSARFWKATYDTASIDVANVGSDTRSTTNIVEGQVGDVGVKLEQEGERLADTSASTEDGDLLLASSRGGEETV